MPRSKKILNPATQWTLILLGGLSFIYVSLHWQNIKSPKPSGSVAAVLTAANSDVLDIPTLNISAPIIYSRATKESDIQTQLTLGIVHLSGTADPGDVGNAFIVGHSSNYKNALGNFNEVFKALPNIQVGDTITVIHNGKTLDFVVYETRVVEPTELWVESQATDGMRVLTLQTSYPVGTAKQRFVAIARLK